MQKKIMILVLLVIFLIIASSCATNKRPSKYMFCTMSSPETAKCSIGDGNVTEIPTSMMIDPPYICSPHEDSKDFVTEFLEKEAELQKCQEN